MNNNDETNKSTKPDILDTSDIQDMTDDSDIPLTLHETDRADEMPDRYGPIEWELWYENLNPDSRHW